MNSAVDFAAVADPDYKNGQAVMFNIVDDAVITNTNSVSGFGLELAGSGWEGTVRQAVYCDPNSLADFQGQFGKRPFR